VQTVFLELLDGRLSTPEEARAFLEPIRRPPAAQGDDQAAPRQTQLEAKLKEHSFDDEEPEDHLEEDEELDLVVGDDDDLELDLHLPKVELDVDLIEDSEAALEDKDEEEDLGLEPVLPLAP